ncbi:helix-turn-helix domain-containing protein [Streptosporangium sp. NBC_01756]|uniref:helix-turn-helix domain-containing protein n=1 Tax=Streptosporangium sp. NBC_01756 TaxID=2975950 RepID=UPI002DD8680B|nr:helix-turn-helix transcriptional regulator [Streptosporangium sp. NBC_01756]WSC90062.1 helix-turn-helix transcriptional regulator [Streptosporangium sp. NBC_01756]
MRNLMGYLVDMHTPSDLVADQIRKHRERLGLSREDLARECKKLGAPQLTAAAIINIEVGRRNPQTGKRRREVSVDELLIFAYAMAVPPLQLMFPVGRVDEAPVPPAWSMVNPMLGWRWAAGEEAPSSLRADGLAHVDRSRIGENGPTRYEAWRQVVHPVKLYHRLTDEVLLLKKATNRMLYLERIGEVESEEGKHVAQLRQHHLTRVAEALEEMMTAGYSVPAYDQGTVEEIQSTGILTHPEALPVLGDQGDVGE